VSGQPTSSDQQRRQVERRVRLVQWVLLVVVVLLTTLPTVILDQRSRVFLLKVVIAAILTFLPGWLYLQFIKFKGRSLYDEFVLNLFRLRIDKYCNLPAPPQHTSYYHEWKKDHDALLADADVKTKDNLYRRKFEAIFGRNAVSTASLLDQPGDRPSVRDRTEAFSPVLVATLLIGVGWALVVQPEFLRTFDLVSRLSGEPQVPYKALQYGFLGAYWFILQDLIRRYFRDDLKTGAYISAAARIVIVALIVTAVGLIPFLSDRPEQQQIFAFFVGIFPQIGLQALKAALTKLFGGVVPTVKTEYPLSDLDGLSIWDQARLLEEGIEDMENLTTANLVDVMLRTRVPITRLVDWLDQAFLLLHMPNTPKDRYAERRVQLRHLGIRTATDLERAWTASENAPTLRAALSEVFDGGKGADSAAVLAFLSSLEGDVNLTHVRTFKRHDWLDDQPKQPPETAPPPPRRDSKPARV
jgi:hypothetical protein